MGDAEVRQRADTESADLLDELGESIRFLSDSPRRLDEEVDLLTIDPFHDLPKSRRGKIETIPLVDPATGNAQIRATKHACCSGESTDSLRSRSPDVRIRTSHVEGCLFVKK